MHELYSIFEGNVDISWDYKKDVIFFIEASTLFLQGYYDRAYDIFSRISEDSDYYGLTQYLSVHCMLRLDNIDSAIITGFRRKNTILPGVTINWSAIIPLISPTLWLER